MTGNSCRNTSYAIIECPASVDRSALEKAVKAYNILNGFSSDRSYPDVVTLRFHQGPRGYSIIATGRNEGDVKNLASGVLALSDSFSRSGDVALSQDDFFGYIFSDFQLPFQDPEMLTLKGRG